MGPRDSAVPTNSLMPAWDTAMGGLAVVGLLAALRHRDRTGEGQLVKIALSDVAFATVGNLGRIAEVQLEGRDQPRDGNYLYGAFGGDFPTSDGRRVMVVALTSRQWKALKEATGTEELFATVEQATGHDFRGEAGRYKGRDLIRELLTPWFAARALEEIRAAFAGTGVSWGPYQTFKQLVDEDPRCSTAEPDVHRGRAPGRDVPHAGVAAGVLAQRPPARAAARRGSASTPTRSSPSSPSRTRRRHPARQPAPAS